MLGWCDNGAYKQIRTAWFEQLMHYTEEISMSLGQTVRSVLSCADGHLRTPLKSRYVVSVWDAVVGQFPVLWTNGRYGKG